ncbi:hypothetical protein CFC21_032674 [Triticum aestivum]|uniref:Phytosulfokine receptor n=3 Tax=Triticum aestivum TaxID=4565 RepID=A0A9R1JJN4_WHEAT|nr:hypothetical protein CFC21_032674 [Triticum aestivum]
MNLTVLDISSNAFSGGFNITALCVEPVKALRFSRNGFNGEILAGFGRCRVLAELSIDGSGLTGNLPSDLYTLSELRRPSLRENQLSGGLISEYLGNFSQLMHIDLSYNLFTGVIPDVFGGLRRLEFLNLATNSFSGTLPASLSSCPMLRVINLRNNSLSGEIAVHFNLLPRLNVLDAGSNMLSGAIPPSLVWCTKLKTLNFGRNKLEGEIPESFKNLQSLLHLSLVHSGFTNLSSALRVLQHLPKLTSLVLTKNLRGVETLPMDGISGFKSMQVLVLAHCALSSMIPPWLQNLESLRVLDLSWNKLNGTIPLWLGNLNNLFYLDLSNNSFSGELPESFIQIKSLLSSNYSSEHASIEGFPLFKKNSADKGLQYNHVSSFPPSLILSNNLLVKPVLPGLGHLVNLHVLNLSWNNFSGGIPDELSNMSSLEALNLSHNDLSGSIPASLTKLTFLSKFDVSYNLAGDIPTGGQFSTFANADFVGNSALCILRNASCTEEAPFVETGNEQHRGMDTTMPAMTYITGEVGFAFGLLIVWNVLFFIRPWRVAYFLTIDRFFDMIYVMTVVKVNMLRRKWEYKVHP